MEWDCHLPAFRHGVKRRDLRQYRLDTVRLPARGRQPYPPHRPEVQEGLDDPPAQRDQPGSRQKDLQGPPGATTARQLNADTGHQERHIFGHRRQPTPNRPLRRERSARGGGQCAMVTPHDSSPFWALSAYRPGHLERFSGPLNEGRGANPGDTGYIVPTVLAMKIAQRRPERAPRRRGTDLVDHPRVPIRSTKAGARTPATRLTSTGATAPGPSAQRRPGRESRRHRPRPAMGRGAGTRSTKAGARTPATLDTPKI